MRARLPHVIELQQPDRVQDPITGEITTRWVTYRAAVAAKVTPLSGRELIAAQAEYAQMVARIQINYDANVTPAMRALFRGKIYVLHGALPDNVTGLQWLTLPVSEGVSDD